MDTPTINAILNSGAIILAGIAAWFSQRNHKKLNSGSTIMIAAVTPPVITPPAAVEPITLVVNGITYKQI